MTIAFFLGLAIVFSLLGMTANIAGQFLKTYLTLFTQVAGLAILLFGLLLIFGKGFSGMKFKQKKPTGYLGSFLFGAGFGLGWTPCIGPILVSVLLLASTVSSGFMGGLLLFVYAVGLSLPLIIVSFFLDKVNPNNKIWKIIQGKELEFSIAGKIIRIHSNNLIAGILFIILGYLIFSGTLFSFNQFVTTTDFQKTVFGIEDWLLKLSN